MRVKLKSILLTLIFLMVGCTTSTTGLWEKPSYNETINQFLITTDGEKLIFIGEKYHYIFTNQDSLNSVLQWRDRKILKANFYDKFSVDANNKITGRYSIICECNDATNVQIQWLENNGFHRLIKKNSSLTDEKVTYINESQISGDRYLSNNLSLDKYAKLNNEYKIEIETDYTFLGTVGRIGLTPIAVAEDGVATFMLIPIMAIGIPFYVINSVFPPKNN